MKDRDKTKAQLIDALEELRQNVTTLETEDNRQDLAERRRTEEKLKESNRRLAQALIEQTAMQGQIIQQERLRAIGQMAVGIAHHFNNALMPILGFTEVLLNSPKNLDDKEIVRQYLRMMNTTAQDAATMIQHLCEFYRDRGKDESSQPINMNDLVTQIVELTQPKWKNEARGNDITISVETHLQAVGLVKGMEAELRDVLLNLIFNAVDAMPQGGTITVWTRPDNEHVVLEVSDTGIGMTEEVRQRCFDPFFSTKGGQGTGMGLAVVYGTVQRHGGEILVESELGVKTTITLRLPVYAGQQPGACIQEVGAPLRPLHILIVDDEPLVREVVTAYLTGDGHTIETATDGHEGFEKFQVAEFDLVIVDKAMPQMNGDELATAIKQISPNTIVLMLTGFGSLVGATREKSAGVDYVVSKPITLANFREVLTTLFSQ